LKRHDGCRLKAQFVLEVLRDLTHETLERQLSDEKVRRLLVLADLAQRYGVWAVAVRLLDADAVADLRATLAASALRGALPSVDLRAVCLVRAIIQLTVLSLRQSG
jgi:hypothetical protein